MRYQSAGLRQILDGTAIPGALAIYQRPAHRGDHRPEGAHAHTRVMLRIPVWLPRQVRQGTSGVLRVWTAADHFLVARGPDTATWTVNADHVRRWVMAYDRQRQRLEQDVAADRHRRPREHGMRDRLNELAIRHHSRLTTWAHTVSRQLIDHVVHRRFDSIVYDDAERRYVRSFPWDALRQRIQEKAEEAGVTFSYTRTAAGAPVVVGPEEDVTARADIVET